MLPLASLGIPRKYMFISLYEVFVAVFWRCQSWLHQCWENKGIFLYHHSERPISFILHRYILYLLNSLMQLSWNWASIFKNWIQLPGFNLVGMVLE
jgi:hypothetical protein